MSEQFEQGKDDDAVNNPSASCGEAEQTILANSSEIYEVDGTIYVDFRCIDPMQLEGVASTGQVNGPQQSAVKGRLVYRAAISPDMLQDLDQQLRQAITGLRKTSGSGCIGESPKGELQ